MYEDVGIEGAVAVPLDVLDSSRYHALLIQPLTGSCSWRDPVLLTKDFLYNPMNFQHVSRCHALSGIVVQKERLNVHVAKKHRITGDVKRKTVRGYLLQNMVVLTGPQLITVGGCHCVVLVPSYLILFLAVTPSRSVGSLNSMGYNHQSCSFFSSFQ